MRQIRMLPPDDVPLEARGLVWFGLVWFGLVWFGWFGSSS
jgi:hypothetical protein